jgi:predicted MFS family arabinose efflux permease
MLATRSIPRPMPIGADRLRLWTIGLIAFLTLVDLFAAQAILPSLAAAYAVPAATMGVAVNASTIGMAAAGLAVALFGRHLPRRAGVGASLALLAVPTALLATMPDLATFTALRIAQGVLMATAFTLTMAYLAETTSARETATALAAYVTGNVASNLVGRLAAAAAADHLGLASTFLLFAALNLAGAALAWASLTRCTAMGMEAARRRSALAGWLEQLRTPALAASFAIGFLILFVFIGTFTYVNFVLVGPPLGLAPMQLGFVYLVFLPALLTTPLAGAVVARLGVRPAFRASLLVAGAGLPLLLAPKLPPVLVGLALVAVGTFLAQAAATGYVSRAATSDRGAASGLYLASYYLGGLAGSAVLGLVFDRLGWPATVLGLGLGLVVAALLAGALQPAAATRPARAGAD